jgi:RNA polymerase sigma factor (sigma-70 family)
VDDRELLMRWGEGDAGAGDALVTRHYPAVYRFFRNKAPGHVDDLTQRTFLACTEGRARFEQRSSFRSFLFGVARHVLYEHFRQRRRDQAIDFGLSTAEGLDPSASQKLAARDEQQRLLTAMRRLPLDLQVALELYYWEDLGVAEIAEVLETPVGTVKSRLQRARVRLDELIVELSESDDLLKSTMDNFDKWARELQQHLGPQKPD